MRNLQVFTHNEIDVVDSRDVARMVERPHKDLMKSIRSYCEYLGQGDFSQSSIEAIEKLGGRKISPSDFFIPSTYTNSQNKKQPCYLLTKKGCDMVANKMTGEKGILFTAAYVTAFEKMREHIQEKQAGENNSPLVEAKLRNARSREARTWIQLANLVPIPEYKQICASHASAVLAGSPVLPLPAAPEKLYTAAEIGQILGGISEQRIGKLANSHGLKQAEFGQMVWDKARHSAKQIQSWRYNEKAIEKFREILKEAK